MRSTYTTDDEIVLPETRPETEWILESARQKMSPNWQHSILQGAVTELLRRWARGSGFVGSEWRYRLTPPGERTRPLVPDISFLSHERSRELTDDELLAPVVAPEIVVEIISPYDRRSYLTEKRRVYFACGVRVAFFIDPQARTIDVYDSETSMKRFVGDSVAVCAAFSDLRIDLAELLAEIERPNRQHRQAPEISS